MEGFRVSGFRVQEGGGVGNGSESLRISLNLEPLTLDTLNPLLGCRQRARIHKIVRAQRQLPGIGRVNDRTPPLCWFSVVTRTLSGFCEKSAVPVG